MSDIGVTGCITSASGLICKGRFFFVFFQGHQGGSEAGRHRGWSPGGALVQDGRMMYPGYAAVEYVQVRCRSRHAHLDP